MRKNNYIISYLTCPKCGNMVTVPRKMGKQRKVGHIKDIWCPWCCKVEKFIEQQDKGVKTLDGEIVW